MSEHNDANTGDNYEDSYKEAERLMQKSMEEIKRRRASDAIARISGLMHLEGMQRHIFLKLARLEAKRMGASNRDTGRLEISRDGTVTIGYDYGPDGDYGNMFASKDDMEILGEAIDHLYRRLVIRNPQTLRELISGEKADSELVKQVLNSSIGMLIEAIPEIAHSPFGFTPRSKQDQFFESALDLLEPLKTESDFKRLLARAGERTCHPDAFMLRDEPDTLTRVEDGESVFAKLTQSLDANRKAYRREYAKAMRGVKRPSLKTCFQTIVGLQSHETYTAASSAIDDVRDALAEEIIRLSPENPGLEAVKDMVEKNMHEVLGEATTESVEDANLTELPTQDENSESAKLNFDQRYVAATSDPLPGGTIPYARAGEEEEHELLPDQFGVREFNLYSGDTPEYQGTTLISYGSGTDASDDIRARVHNTNLDGDTINRVGELVCDFFEAHEMLMGARAICEPVDDLEFAVSILPKSRSTQTVVADVRTAMQNAAKRVGVAKDELLQSIPKMIEKIIELLNELHTLDVLYFCHSDHKVDLNGRTFRYYISQMESANVAA